jgi:hypothetical protein
MIRDMKPNSSRSFIGSVIGGCALFLVLASLGYVAGYLLLPNKSGLYGSKWQFNLFRPAMYTQRWITNKPVSSGYIDPNGMHHSMTLQYPPVSVSGTRALPVLNSAKPGTPTQAPQMTTQRPVPSQKK